VILRPRKYRELEKALGHRFKNQQLIEVALTHASMRGGKSQKSDNERLEFIGDRVLGLVMAEAMIEQFPTASEGELARRFNRLVRGEACARVARSLGIGSHLILSEREAGSGGRAKATILADAMEAILGAVFLDAGFETARGVVRQLWGSQSDQQPTSAGPDAKSALQEWAQGRGLPAPAYKEVERKGPHHDPEFRISVSLPDQPAVEGIGSSKRAAEQAAATAMLARVGIVADKIDG
jgi:ribonuclease-3